MAARNDQFKPTFTVEERQECFQWFEQHMDELPREFHAIRSIRILDLPMTIRCMMTKLSRRSLLDGTFSGQFSLLLLIRRHLIEDGLLVAKQE